MPMIELLAPSHKEIGDKVPIMDWLGKNGISPYHICYKVDDMELTIKEQRKQKYLIVSNPKIACAINDKKVAFLYKRIWD